MTSMKVVILLLAIATVSLGATSGLKAHLGLKNKVQQDEEALLLSESYGAPEEVNPEEYYAQPYTNEDVPVEAYTSYAPVITTVNEESVGFVDEWQSTGLGYEELPTAPVILPIEEPVAGGWTVIDLATISVDPAIQGLIQLAIDVSLDEGRRDGKVPAGVEYTLDSIESVQRQVVAGFNYRIQVWLTDGGDRRVHIDTNIFDQSWSHTRKVTSTCIRVGRMVQV